MKKVITITDKEDNLVASIEVNLKEETINVIHEKGYKISVEEEVD